MTQHFSGCFKAEEFCAYADAFLTRLQILRTRLVRGGVKHRYQASGAVIFVLCHHVFVESRFLV
ncbi:hypothetical protein GGP41_010377 [Bipolaris sorokiniana]|uniref:Uncharacterized protein n=1 Tax=Cochliobolus sativus TaxID=45130 RepID=A0A8H5ZK58_COCSA|nr:hypothetical protein GGP41_010377 [Bipolaris sorokiniana]